eukprot:CAMPEP_0197025292 /NCGR_PEP_ID=MMETSP1384-20130603/5678_1 /TAXON_ID=29189 /ORGANISM="Ammonia sp." /LENGTH=404 /DNA_ID=CAMNT_0042453809 /DNA_START=85 /DNA_END=1299 /DNA_ORIENTATION=+
MYGSVERNELEKRKRKCWCNRLWVAVLAVFAMVLCVVLASLKFGGGNSSIVELAHLYDSSIVNADEQQPQRAAYSKLSQQFSIYVIVTEARRQYMDDMLSNVLQWDHVSYVNAINKDTLDRSQLVENDVIAENIRNYKPGRVACVLSHKSAMEHFLNDEDAKYALILEDDVMLNPYLDYKPEVYINKLLELVPNDWNFINFGRCWDWCSSTTPLDADGLLLDSQNPLCTHVYAVTKEGAQRIVKDILPLSLLNIDQIIARKIRSKELTGYASAMPILLQNKKELGSLAAPNSNIPYNLCASLVQELISKLYDGPYLTNVLSSDGWLSSDAGWLSSDSTDWLSSDGGWLSSDSWLSSDGSWLSSDGWLSSDSARGAMGSNSIIARIVAYFSANAKQDGPGDLYIN